MKAFVFPGQGAQFVGMGKDLYDNSPLAKELFEKANEILGIALQILCLKVLMKISVRQKLLNQPYFSILLFQPSVWVKISTPR